MLEAALLDDRYKEGFDIVERRRHRGYVDRGTRAAYLKESSCSGAAHGGGRDPAAFGDPNSKFFEFDMKTGVFTKP